MLTARLVDIEKDFGFIKACFDARSFPVPVKSFLPPTGAIVFLNEVPIAAGFLFKTDAKIASIGHLVSDPSVAKGLRQNAVNAVVDCLTLEALESGFEMVTCAATYSKLHERFEEMGFEKTDVGVAHFRRFLCQ